MADFTNQLLLDSIYHLLNFEKYSSFPMAARECALACNFQMVIFSDDFNPVFSVETRHGVSLEEAARMGIETDIQHSTENTKLLCQGIVTYWGPVNIKEKKYYLMLVDNDDCYSQEEIVKLAEIIELAMGMWNYLPERDVTAEFIRAIRRGTIQLASSLMDELGLCNDDLVGVYFVPNVKRDEALKLISAQEDKYSLKTLRVIETREVAGIILKSSGSSDFGEPEWKALAKDLSEEAGAPKTFHVIGTKNVEDLCAAFKLINETEAFVQLIFPYKHSFSKYELALANNCINICLNGGSVKKYYQDLISGLKLETKDSKSKQLMETLECFMLDSGMNAAKTAKIMKVHVNTVQYRIKRIRDILGVDITGNTIIPGLMTALAVSRIQKEARNL